MKIYTITITTSRESVLHVCDETTLDAIRAKAITALKRGREVKWFNGVVQWVEYSPIIYFDRKGSDSYTWDESGNKVKNEILLYSKVGDDVICEQIGTCFRKFI